jgi:urease accessory protein
MLLGAIRTSEGPVGAMQRAKGRGFVSVGLSRGATRLIDLSQSGSARIMLPRVAGLSPEAVFLNTSGGLTSGDTLGFAMSVGDGARLIATTQTAERAYLARSGPALLSVDADVGAGARLDWLPQETILFQGADLKRETRINLGRGASCLLTEIITLGRRAMGEVLTNARLSDRRVVTAEGRLLHIEALHLTPEALGRAASAAMLGQAHVFASLALCGPGAETAADALRGLAPPDGVTAAVSGWNGRSLLRATASDLWPLKLYLGRAIAQLTHRPLPRVWQMQGAAA